MDDHTTQFRTIVQEKSQKTRKFKPCVRIPKKLKNALEGKLNIVIDHKSTEHSSPLSKRKTFDLAEIDNFSSIKDTSEKPDHDLDNSDHSIPISDDNPSVSSFNIVKKCQFLNGIITEAGASPHSPLLQINRKASADIDSDFNFTQELQRPDPKGRINRRDIVWDSEVHDIYDPEFTSESDSCSDYEDMQLVPATPAEDKPNNSTYRESLNVKAIDRIVDRHISITKPGLSKKHLSRIDNNNPIKRVNTPMSIGVMKMQVLDFKKKIKPRAMSIKPSQSKSMIKNMPQFKSRALLPSHMGSKYLSSRPSVFDSKDQSDIKKPKRTNLALNSSPSKIRTLDERIKTFKYEQNAHTSIQQRINGLKHRHNTSTMSNNAKLNSESLHF